MSFPEHGAELGWVAEVLSWEDITWDDLQGGFVFLQIISVLSPQAVDLSWYSSAAALECSNTSVQIKADLITGLRCLGLSDEQIPEATVDCVIDGDIKASCEVVGALRRMRADLEATRKSSLAPTPDLSAGARSESGLKERVDHGLGEFMGDGDGVSGDEWYEAAELSFKPALRWLCLHVNAHILETTAPSAIIEGFLVELDDPRPPWRRPLPARRKYHLRRLDIKLPGPVDSPRVPQVQGQLEKFDQ
ncbi:uncharacterized protein EV422DRAFT_6009 [Fimicolochytrium jonesii]|uniref:uncharacterized protein n=1 Tax=Fimicolochytrium jonesii TaxID=1396493 RepID=UPI0022FF1EBE|nr:uncharacterized protein EV422DRAFT_6009 [Fimicolochytrium jonesii]KAI8826669.1 hypothetical protein EV422DRAFT_6009 [Fimicolochytrium jonesii]